MNVKIFEEKPYIDQMIRDYIDTNLTGSNNFIFTYALINKQNPHFFNILSNAPAWYEQDYKSNKRHFTDPVIFSALNCMQDGFYWDQQVMSQSLGSTEIFNEAKYYEIMQGYTFVLNDVYSNVAMLTLIRKKTSLEEFKYFIDINKISLLKILRGAHDLNLKERGICSNVHPSVLERYQVDKTDLGILVRKLKDNEVICSLETVTELLEKNGYSIVKKNDRLAS